MISLRWFCAKFFVKIRFDRFGIFAVVGLDDLVGFLRLCDVQAVYTQQRGGQARPAGGAAPYRMIFGMFLITCGAVFADRLHSIISMTVL